MRYKEEIKEREKERKNGWEVRDEMKLKREEREKLKEDDEDYFPQKRKGI